VAACVAIPTASRVLADGACCLPDGVCDVMSDFECELLEGEFQGDGTSCDPNPCDGAPVGACCFDNGGCAVESESDCQLAGGSYQGDFTDCESVECPGACDRQFRADSNCDGSVDFDDIDCFVAALISEGQWLLCVDDAPCSYRCVNDVNQDGSVDFGDIDPFVECLINGGCR
jgi:hypothetical protein